MVRVEGTGGMPGVDLLKGMSDLLADWAPNDKVRNRILVESAAARYGCPKGA